MVCEKLSALQRALLRGSVYVIYGISINMYFIYLYIIQLIFHSKGIIIIGNNINYYVFFLCKAHQVLLQLQSLLQKLNKTKGALNKTYNNKLKLSSARKRHLRAVYGVSSSLSCHTLLSFSVSLKISITSSSPGSKVSDLSITL